MKTLFELINSGITLHKKKDGLVYKYTDIETAKLILTNETLLFQSVDKFNDPFELHNGFYDFNCNDEILRNWLERNNISKNKIE